MGTIAEPFVNPNVRQSESTEFICVSINPVRDLIEIFRNVRRMVRGSRRFSDCVFVTITNKVSPSIDLGEHIESNEINHR